MPLDASRPRLVSCRSLLDPAQIDQPVGDRLGGQPHAVGRPMAILCKVTSGTAGSPLGEVIDLKEIDDLHAGLLQSGHDVRGGGVDRACVFACSVREHLGIHARLVRRRHHEELNAALCQLITKRNDRVEYVSLSLPALGRPRLDEILNRGTVEEPAVAPQDSVVASVLEKNEAGQLHPGPDHLSDTTAALQTAFQASEVRTGRLLPEELRDLRRIARA